jgi:hypothetical protein
MLRWRVNLAEILKDPKVEAAILARIRAHDDNPNSWVILDAFQKYFSQKNEGCDSNFFIFKDLTQLVVNQEGIKWLPGSSTSATRDDDCEYSTWYIAQRVGTTRWAKTFLGPFPQD